MTIDTWCPLPAAVLVRPFSLGCPFAAPGLQFFSHLVCTTTTCKSCELIFTPPGLTGAANRTPRGDAPTQHQHQTSTAADTARTTFADRPYVLPFNAC